jgi:hypothetical protein
MAPARTRHFCANSTQSALFPCRTAIVPHQALCDAGQSSHQNILKKSEKTAMPVLLAALRLLN